MPDLWMNVDAALSEVPVNVLPLLDDTDFKTRKTAIAYNETGMDLVWNFTTVAGVFTQTAVTPTSGGDYDWVNQGDGMYTIEIPASGGASINNSEEGFGWFTGVCDAVLPWRGPVIGFRHSELNELTNAWFDYAADHLLGRNPATARSGAKGDWTGRFVLQAISAIRNEKDPSGTQLIIRREDGTTEEFRFDLTTDSGADPVTGMDPTT